MEAKTMTLVERLRMLSKMIALGDRIQWGSDSEIMEEAASLLEEAEKALEPFANAVIGEFINDDEIADDDFRLARSVRDKLKGGE